MRIRYLDKTRAICMIWIVAVWHLADYCDITINNQITQNITYGVLGAFTFLSGIMLGGKIASLKDTLAFYKRRFIRIYPLFAVSCTSMLLLYIFFDVRLISGLPQYLLTMVGLSIIFTPAPGTIWYVSMLLLFYILTPLLLFRSSSQKWRTILKGAAIYGTFLLIQLSQISNVDERLLYLFPVYCVGLVVGRKKISIEKFSVLPFAVGLLAFVGLTCVQYVMGKDELGLKIVNTISIIAAFIVIAMECGKLFVGKVGKLLEKISYASMCAYLFHRQIYGIFAKLIGTFSIIEAFVFFLCTIVTCYYIQLKYDAFCRRVIKTE